VGNALGAALQAAYKLIVGSRFELAFARW
jgi:hypothetical protein